MIWENVYIHKKLIHLFSLDSLDMGLFIFWPALGWGVVNISCSLISGAKMEHAS